MANPISPTKGNLMNAQHSLQLASMGYDLMDRKRNVLIREMMSMVAEVRKLKSEISTAYSEAYIALQQANMSLGVITKIAEMTPIEDSVHVVYRSIMGVEIPQVSIVEKPIKLSYSMEESNSKLDEAYVKLVRVKYLTVKLAEIDNAVYRLAKAVSRTQKRANALQNLVIPNLRVQIRQISSALEEKDREEFTRMKVIKKQKQR